YLAKTAGGWSTTRIGRFYNGRDHSTVCHAIRRIEALRESDPEVDGLLTGLRHALSREVSETAGTVVPDVCARTQSPVQVDAELIEALADRVAARVLEIVLPKLGCGDDC